MKKAEGGKGVQALALGVVGRMKVPLDGHGVARGECERYSSSRPMKGEY
jgi:hypothetical protein